MKVDLKKKLILKSATVYLKLQREIERKDIQDYLQDKKSFKNNPIIENRVREYLKSIGIYNEHYDLTTPYGYEVKNKGMVKENEEGKYQIWFTLDDFLFGNRIFYFRRIKPEPYKQNQKLDSLELDFSGQIFRSLPIQGKDAQDSIEFSIIDTEKKYPVEKNNTTEISFIWTWNDIQSSSFTFSGKFETVQIDMNKHVDFQINLEQHIPTVIPDWNNETRRCKLKIEDIEKDDIYQYFEYSGNRPCDGYDSCVFDKLPIEPYNYEEAVLWRDKIINMELEKEYMHPDDFNDKIIEINDKDGFSAYSTQLELNVPNIDNYIEKLDSSKKSDRTPAYWHLAAPLDLNVDIPQSLKIDHFSLSKEEDRSISFSGLAAKFGNIRAEKIFFYDKYVYTYYQQRSISTFLSCFGVSDICVITETDNPEHKFNNYLVKNKPEITVVNISDVYQDTKDAPHDRYIVFKTGSDLVVWTSTNSIDFIRFDKKGEITPDTFGTILKSVTFAEVKRSVLGTDLLKRINK